MEERGSGTSLEHTALAEAYRQCERLVHDRYENFTVASRVLPREVRPHLAAIYAYCRTVDDLGDEFPGDRLRALDRLEGQVRFLYGGPAVAQTTETEEIGLPDWATRALMRTIRVCDLPMGPFLDLIEANRMDQTVTAFDTFDALRGYTRCSAEPVGRLVLRVLGDRDAGHAALSDDTCTALQLANFWQDVGPDLARGRLYLPLEDLDRFGLTRESLGRPGDPRVHRLLAMEVDRTYALFRKGAPLEACVSYRFGLQLRLYRLGGEAILAAIARQNFDPFVGRPHLGGWAKVRVGLRAVLGGPRTRVGGDPGAAPRATEPDVHPAGPS